LKDTKPALHGETVAFGLIVQLVLEERSDGFIEELLAFYRAIGLPCTLRQLGLAEPDDGKLAEIAGPTAATPISETCQASSTRPGYRRPAPRRRHRSEEPRRLNHEDTKAREGAQR